MQICDVNTIDSVSSPAVSTVSADNMRKTEEDNRMKAGHAPSNPATGSIRSIACAVALAGAFVVSMPGTAYAGQVTPPAVPANIQIPAGNKAFLKGYAVGTQNYVCLPSGDGFKFSLFTPQATLFDDDGKEVMTHYFSPNRFENPPPPGQISDGTVRATWQHSRNTSTVWGKVVPGDSSSDPAFVAPNSIPWLRITVVGVDRGPGGGDTLTATTFIQRLNTSGGVAPSTGCASASDVGNQAFVPYTADYFFYRIE